MNEREQKDFDMAQRLYRAGVGTKYHRKTLETLGDMGKMMQDWLASGGCAVDAAEGKPVVIYGPNSYAATMLLSRALVVTNVPVRSYFLPNVFSNQDPEEPTDFFLHGTITVIKQFYVEGYEENPMPKWMKFSVEDALIEKMDSGDMLILQSTHPLDECEWWTTHLRGYISSADPVTIQAG